MNIKMTTENYLCNSCAACKSVCPQNAINMSETASGQLIPVVNDELCNLCGKCISICQGYNFINFDIFSDIDNIFHGNSICGFVGKSTDESVYVNSQSGGIATSLALNILEDEEVDGVLVTAMTDTYPPRPYAILAKSREEILLSQKSKYCPTPLLENICQILHGIKKIAIVGLPCHIHAIINLCNSNSKFNDKIKYKIGLICDRVMTYAAIDYLLKLSKINQNGKIEFNFRNKSSYGFPGDVTIKNNIESCVLSAQKRMEIKDYFTPPRCLLCFDKMNIFSDITVGDPHGLENYDKRNGETAVVVRTKKGLSLIKNCLKNNSITLRDTTAQSIFKGQQIELHKKRVWSGYTNAWEEIKLPLPHSYTHIKKCEIDNKKIYKDQVLHSLNTSKCEDKNKILIDAHRKFNKKNTIKKIENIEIKGVGFVNKGAELMLESILQHFHGQKFNFAMEPIIYNSTYQQRAKKEIFQKLSVDGNLFTGIPDQICNLYGLIKDEDIHAVLDASGFCYGEQWGDGLTEEMARRIKRWKNQGTKVILLPQAFGPFKSPRIRTAMRSIVTNADIIFARDKESYEHIISLKTPHDNVHISPDFTTIIKGIKPTSPEKFADKICIIPNAMIYKKLPAKLSDNYLFLLKKIIGTAYMDNIECFILIHEGNDDLKIGVELQKTSKNKPNIITEPDPLLVKGIIGSCYAVTSSRFHGIVSALSQSVPTLCTGWSHKYKMLMDDYDCSQFLIELDCKSLEIEKKALMIIDKIQNDTIRNKLHKNSHDQKILVHKMWNKVDSLLKN